MKMLSSSFRQLDCVCFQLLMVTCLTSITNSVVYHVVPDDHYLDTNNNTLQHYLDNSEKYFTSHTQLVFLPGKHHLTTDLIVENVSNFTLRGYSTQLYNTMICLNNSHVFIGNSSDIEMRYLSMKGVQMNPLISPPAILHIFDSSDILIDNSIFVCQFHQCGLLLSNTMGLVQVYNITSGHLLITHNMTRNESDMEVSHYTHIGHPSYKTRAIEIFLYEHSQFIIITLLYAKFEFDKAIGIHSFTSKGGNMIKIVALTVTDITLKDYLITVTMDAKNNVLKSRLVNVMQLVNCHFSKIQSYNEKASIGIISLTQHVYNYFYSLASFTLLKCTFSNIIQRWY